MRLADTSVRMYRKGNGAVSFRMHSYLMVPARGKGFRLTTYLTDFVGSLKLASGQLVALDDLTVREDCLREMDTMVHEFRAWGDAELKVMQDTVGLLQLKYRLFGSPGAIDLVVPVVPRGPTSTHRGAML